MNHHRVDVLKEANHRVFIFVFILFVCKVDMLGKQTILDFGGYVLETDHD